MSPWPLRDACNGYWKGFQLIIGVWSSEKIVNDTNLSSSDKPMEIRFSVE